MFRPLHTLVKESSVQNVPKARSNTLLYSRDLQRKWHPLKTNHHENTHGMNDFM